MRAVTRQETTAVMLDAELYDKQLNKIDPSDSHAAVCREVRDASVIPPPTIGGLWGGERQIFHGVLPHPLAVFQ